MAFPESIALSDGTTWRSHQTVQSGTTQIDGYLVDKSGQTIRQLDLATLDDAIKDVYEDAAGTGVNVDVDVSELRINVEDAWTNGGVFVEDVGVTSLVVPAPELTADVCTEALNRYRR